MSDAAPVQMPSSWGGAELKVLSSRVQSTRTALASLRNTTPRVDAWLEAAALAEQDWPLRDLDGNEPAPTPKREAFPTVRRRVRARAGRA